MPSRIQAQMGCCLFCGGPMEPSREALRRDRVCSRALNFIEGDAIQHKSQWNIEANTDPTLVSAKEECHFFHVTNVLPAMDAFLSGKLKGVWGNNNTPKYYAADFPADKDTGRELSHGIAKGDTNVPSDMYVIGTKRKVFASFDVDGDINTAFKAVAWGAPGKFDGFAPLATLIEECIGRIGGVLVTKPQPLHSSDGCKMCNNIMTQEGTSSHFLVRMDNHLVEDQAILCCDMSSLTKFKGTYRYDPSDNTRTGRQDKFSYEACVAYYIHRCLPSKPSGTPGRAKLDLRYVSVFFSFIILEMACLIYERNKGKDGGKTVRTKPVYRYRGCTETYLAYLYWVLFRNDNPHGVADGRGQKRCMLEFHQFHRYFFCEVLDTLVLAAPELAFAGELGDMVFGNQDLEQSASEILGDMCKCVSEFYTKYLKPYFSRHLASLEPDPSDHLYHAQILVGEMVILVEDLTNVMHMLEKGTAGDIDTFINCTGVGSVLSAWHRYLTFSPCRSTTKLLDDFVDTLVRVEYANIAASMSSDPERPSVSVQAAETIYLMCNALELPSEPDNEEELQLLRAAPKCSRVKAVPRVSMVGGYSEEPVALIHAG